MNRLTSGLLFLPLQQGIKTDAVNRENPVTRSWKVTVRLTLSATNPFYLDLIMLVNEVQRPIARKKSRHCLSVLDYLGPYTVGGEEAVGEEVVIVTGGCKVQ